MSTQRPNSSLSQVKKFKGKYKMQKSVEHNPKDLSPSVMDDKKTNFKLLTHYFNAYKDKMGLHGNVQVQSNFQAVKPRIQNG